MGLSYASLFPYTSLTLFLFPSRTSLILFLYLPTVHSRIHSYLISPPACLLSLFSVVPFFGCPRIHLFLTYVPWLILIRRIWRREVRAVLSNPFATCGEWPFKCDEYFKESVWREMALDISLPLDLLQINVIAWNLKSLWTLKCVIKKWRMGIFIRHKCGERKNIVRHRWVREKTRRRRPFLSLRFHLWNCSAIEGHLLSNILFM